METRCAWNVDCFKLDLYTLLSDVNMKSKCILAFFLISLFFFLVNLVLSPFIASLFDLEVGPVSLGLSVPCAVLLFCVGLKLMAVAEMEAHSRGAYRFWILVGTMAVLLGSPLANSGRFGIRSFKNGYIRSNGLCNRLGFPVIKGGDWYCLAVDALGDKVLISINFEVLEKDDDLGCLVEYTIKYHNSRGRVLDVRRCSDWYSGFEFDKETSLRNAAEIDDVKIYAFYDSLH